MGMAVNFGRMSQRWACRTSHTSLQTRGCCQPAALHESRPPPASFVCRLQAWHSRVACPACPIRRQAPLPRRTHIIPGLSHWQSPRFFAYFPMNTRHVCGVCVCDV